MQIINCNTKELKNKIISFRRSLYKNNPYMKNSEELTLKDMLFKNTSFSKKANIEPMLIEEIGQVFAAALLIHERNYKDYLQISFFECMEGKEEAGRVLIDYAIEIARKRGIPKILIGMNGHVNYGLGILSNHFETPQSFGASYNPPFYLEIFEGYPHNKVVLTSLIKDLKEFHMSKIDKVIERVNRNYSFKTMNIKDLKSEINIYTELNNEIFKEHKFYYPREYSMDFELFKDLSYIIKGENLIFAYKGSEPIGFLLWYPDFHELVPPYKSFGIGTVLKNKLSLFNIDKIKIVELGVMPKYRNTGVAFGLLRKCYDLSKNKYKYCESSWILDYNFPSVNCGLVFDFQEHKKFNVYEIEVSKCIK